MKKFYLILICLIFIACKKDTQISNNIEIKNLNNITEDFLNSEISGDYELYYNQLSQNYKELLKRKFKANNELVIIDSLTQFYSDLNNKIKNGTFILTNTITDTISTDDTSISLIKYRSKLYDKVNNAELLKIKMLIKISTNDTIKFIPYTYNYTTNIDSLIKVDYGDKILNIVKNSKIIENFVTNDPELKKIEEYFDKYNKSFKKIDNSLFDFLYPPVMNEILKQNGKTSFTPELKTILINSFKEARNRQTLDFKNILIDDIIKVNCDKDKLTYLLSYAIDVGNNAYIPGQVIVFNENDNIYFIEYDKNEFETTLSNIFNAHFLKCLSNKSESTKKNLGVN